MADYETEFFPFNKKPYAHQKSLVDLRKDDTYHALFGDMGIGKTAITIARMVHLFHTGEIELAIVAAPKGVHSNWVRVELPKHLPEHFPRRVLLYDSGKIYHASFKRDKAVFIKRDPSKLRIITVSMGFLSTAKGQEFLASLVKGVAGRAFVIIDESSNIKYPKSGRTRGAIIVGKSAKYRTILSGTAVTQSPTDIYSQCHFLKPGLLGFSSYHAFQHHFCTMKTIRMGPRTFEKVDGFQNLHELKALLAPFSDIIRKQDCLDLPAKTYITRDVEWHEEQKKVYDKLREDYIYELENGGTVDGSNALTRIIRLQQICFGYAVDDKKRIQPLPNNRLDVLEDTINEMGEKIIIWAPFRYPLMQIGEMLEKKYGEDSVVRYYGGIDQKLRDDALEYFQDKTNGVRFFLANPAAAGYGLTLTASHDTIYYGNNYNLEQRLQSEDRNHRIGQENSVTYVDLVIPKSIDEKVLLKLQRKAKMSNEIIRMRDSWDAGNRIAIDSAGDARQLYMDILYDKETEDHANNVDVANLGSLLNDL